MSEKPEEKAKIGHVSSPMMLDVIAIDARTIRREEPKKR